jgi:glycosyltransferase involved in cell wall biosynthesis
MTTPTRIFYAAGPGDAVGSYRKWSTGVDVTSETQLTLSGQFYDFCRTHGMDSYTISSHGSREYVKDGAFIVENRPKPISRPVGIAFHMDMILYGLSLIYSILRFGPHLAVVDSGTTHWFLLSVLKLARIRLIPCLHNTIWPNGFPPKGRVRRALLRLDGWFWRTCADATLCVSPECQRQLETIARAGIGPIFQFRAQYRPALFHAFPQAPAHDARPFRVLFVGRVERAKGVFDIVEIAELLDREFPGQLLYDLCGTGSDLESLRTEIHERGRGSLVRALGRVSREDLINAYANSHVVIIPTRSTFVEGMPAVASEAVLAGRPLITSRLSNALDVLEGAIVEAQPDDPQSYAQCLRRLLCDRALYEDVCAACPPLREQFYDRDRGWTKTLEEAVDSFDRNLLHRSSSARSESPEGSRSSI